MTEDPTPTPATTPLDEPTVATPVLLLLHVPPGVASANVTEEPKHIDVAPVMLAGGENKNNSNAAVVDDRLLFVQVTIQRYHMVPVIVAVYVALVAPATFVQPP